MMKTRRRLWKPAALGLGVFFGSATGSHALIVTPARTEARILPGGTSQVILTATNDDKVEIQVDVSKKDWFIPDVNKAWTSDRWMDVQGPARFYLKPGESQKVEVKLKCPKELVGEVVGMTSFLYQTEHPTMVTPMISVSLYLMAAGTEKISGEVTGMMVRLWNGQYQISSNILATGNVHLRPSGRLLVLDSRGTALGETSVTEGTPTYPGRNNLYYGGLPGTLKLPPGTYIARTDLAYQNVKLQGDQEFKVLKDGQVQMLPMKKEAKVTTSQ